MAATIFVIGDPHFKVSNFKESAKMCETILTEIKNEDPDLVIVLGDLTNDNNTVRTEVLVQCTDWLSDIAKSYPLLVIMGNHDIPGPNWFLTRIHAFTSLCNWQGTKKDTVEFPSKSGVQIVDSSPVEFTVNGLLFCACPYVPVGRFKEAIEKCENWKSSAAIFCHQEFRGCDMDGAVHEESPDEWDNSLPEIISGHIHKDQRFGRVNYPGTPRQTKINESWYKTVSVFRFENGTYTQKKISTKLQPKVDMTIRADEIDSVFIPDEGSGRIEITGTPDEIVIAKKNSKIRVWRGKGYTVKFTSKSVDYLPILKGTSSNDRLVGYKSYCYDKAIQDSLIDIYYEIFG